MDHLLFRRQFLLTSKTIESIPSEWILRNLNTQGNSWHLYTHPDLEVTESTSDNYHLILLGYLLDPFKVELNNQNLLDNIILKGDFDLMVEETHKLNGRFLLFFLDGSSCRVINDASGFRELYYLEEDSGIHCGSTPDIIKTYVGAEKNPDKSVFTFFNSREYVQNSHTWVGHETIFKNLRKLPPNFLLDIQQKKIERFWPNKAIRKESLEEVAIKGADYIKNCLKCAIARKPVHLGVTAGWDTRVLLAASRDLKHRIYYYINKGIDLDEEHPDISIPRRLSKKLGFKLNVLKIDQTVEDDKFRKIFFQNNFRANDSLYPVFHYGFRHKFDHTFTVSGNLAEGSARKYYYPPCKPSKFSGSQISRVVGFADNPYAIRMIDRWLEEASPLCSALNIDILDLYQIEHEASNWCSHTASEQDIIREEVRPFNSRYLISMFWSLGSKHRFLYNPAISRRMINILWKDSLALPINPSWKSNLYIFLRWLKLDHLLFKTKVAVKYMFRRS